MFRYFFSIVFLFALSSVSYAQTSFSVYLERCQELRPKIEQILKEEGLPPYFFYLALAESGCDVYNVSSKNAKGLFQLVPRTFRVYSEGVCFEDKPCPIEAVYDPLTNTRVAAKYLKSLYERFDKDVSWVVAAYNAGGTNLMRKTSYKKGMDIKVVAKIYPQAYNLAMKVRHFSNMDKYKKS